MLPLHSTSQLRGALRAAPRLCGLAARTLVALKPHALAATHLKGGGGGGVFAVGWPPDPCASGWEARFVARDVGNERERVPPSAGGAAAGYDDLDMAPLVVDFRRGLKRGATEAPDLQPDLPT